MRKSTIAIVTVVVVLAAACGYWWYARRAKADDATPISTAKVERGTIRASIKCVGKVIANQDVDIKCKASGQVKKLNFELSKPVTKGQLLVELDPVDMQRLADQAKARVDSDQSKFNRAKCSLTIAEENLKTAKPKADAAVAAAEAHESDTRAKAERMRQLLEEKLASQEDYDTARTAAAQAAADLDNASALRQDLRAQELALELRREDINQAKAILDLDTFAFDDAKQRVIDTKVMAPMDGVIVAQSVQVGQIIASGITTVGGGTTILTISDLSDMFVDAAVDEADVGRVKEGQPVLITADGFPDEKFTGVVTTITPKGVPISNVVTFDVKIKVTSANKSLLKQEMTANVEIVMSEHKDTLIVPFEAVARKKGKQYVWLVKGAGAGEERPVEVGLSDGLHREILSGVAEGDLVVVRANDAESKWRPGDVAKPKAPTGGKQP